MTIRHFTHAMVTNRAFVVPYLISLVFGTIVLQFWSKPEVFYLINGTRSVFADVFFKYFTYIGTRFFCVLTVAFLVFINFGKALKMALILISTGLITQIMKKLVFSEALRPSLMLSRDNYPHTAENVALEMFYSFPSGHTSTAFALCFALCLMISNKKWGVLLFTVAALVGYSRIYLGQHFFVDVYFGSLVGFFTAAFVWIVLERYLRGSWMQKSLWPGSKQV